MSVGVQENVITNIAAEHASNKDSQLLLRNIYRTTAALESQGLEIKEILADTGFSSGENYKMLEQNATQRIYSSAWYMVVFRKKELLNK